MTLNPIRSQKIYEQVADQLKQSILSGAYPPGTRLPSVRELSLRLGVGQSAVREALSALRAVHLITVRQGEGTFVNHYGPADLEQDLQAPLMALGDIQHLLELRKMLEVGTAQLAASRRTEADLESLRETVSRMQAELDSADLGEQTDWQFHRQLAKASHNPLLESLMDNIGEKIQTLLLLSRRRLFARPAEPERLLRQHQRILRAVELQDEGEAALAIACHLQHVETELLEGRP